MSLYESRDPSTLPGQHTSGMSMFGEHFPVDTSNEVINQLVGWDIPHAISGILENRASCEETSTDVKDGGVELYYASAGVRDATLEPALRRAAESANLVVAALLPDVTPTKLHINQLQEYGKLVSFQLVMLEPSQAVAYVLDAELGEPALDFFEQIQAGLPDIAVTTQTRGHEKYESLTPLEDPELASDVLHSLVRAMKNPVQPAANIKDRLQQLLDGTPHKIERVGTFETPSRFSTNPIIATIGQRIVHTKKNRTTDYHIQVEEKSIAKTSDGEATTTSSLSLEFHQRIRRQPYKAQLGVAISDMDEVMPIDKRVRHYENISKMYRDKSVEYFTFIHSVLQRIMLEADIAG